jgi:hypothetical protein
MQSPVKAIEYLEFKKLPSKPVKGTFVYVDGVSVLVGERGALYTNMSPLNRKAWCSGAWGWSERLCEVLLALKVITPEQHSVHLAYVQREEARSAAVSALGELIRASKVPGAGVSKRQVLKLWDSLDWLGQRQAKRYHYQPEGTVLKDEPAA